MLKKSLGHFVNIVASVNRVDGTGKILYVNPSTVSTPADVQKGSSDFDAFALVLEDANGHEMARLTPNVQVASCEDGHTPVTGLISQDVPVQAGMKRIVLYHGTNAISSFESGAPRSAGAVAAGMAPMAVTIPLSTKNNRLALGADPQSAVAIERGVTYTVQVKSQGAPEWQTIAVGRETPDVEIDRNQFPGSPKVAVRVLRSTGFEDEVLSQQDIDLNY
jgi:hypothetical protein